MATVALQQVSSFFAQENAKRTLEKPIRIELFANSLSQESIGVKSFIITSHPPE
jgi:hypothetical protein